MSFWVQKSTFVDFLLAQFKIKKEKKSIPCLFYLACNYIFMLNYWKPDHECDARIDS